MVCLIFGGSSRGNRCATRRWISVMVRCVAAAASSLLRTDEPGSQTHEAVMGVAEIAPGAMAGKHRHPGIEIGYVLEGSVTLEHEGEAAKQLKAGDAFKNEPGVHNARNTGKTPVKILAVYLVEKGKPIAEPVR